jgi:hypothetical protein
MQSWDLNKLTFYNMAGCKAGFESKAELRYSKIEPSKPERQHEFLPEYFLAEIL